MAQTQGQQGTRKENLPPHPWDYCSRDWLASWLMAGASWGVAVRLLCVPQHWQKCTQPRNTMATNSMVNFAIFLHQLRKAYPLKFSFSLKALVLSTFQKISNLLASWQNCMNVSKASFYWRKGSSSPGFLLSHIYLSFTQASTASAPAYKWEAEMGLTRIKNYPRQSTK